MKNELAGCNRFELVKQGFYVWCILLLSGQSLQSLQLLISYETRQLARLKAFGRVLCLSQVSQALCFRLGANRQCLQHRRVTVHHLLAHLVGSYQEVRTGSYYAMDDRELLNALIEHQRGPRNVRLYSIATSLQPLGKYQLESCFPRRMQTSQLFGWHWTCLGAQ